MYKLEPSRAFQKSLKKLSANEQRAGAVKLGLLQQDPFHQSLRTKKVRHLNDVFECSVNMDIRILWQHKEDRIILLIQVGHHQVLDN